jgi:hypothetical protein
LAIEIISLRIVFCPIFSHQDILHSSTTSQRSGFDSRRYRISWEVVGLERSPLSLVSATDDLLERKSSGSGLEIREYGCGDPLHWPRDTLYPQKLAQTSPTSGGRSVGIVRSRTKATECVRHIITKKNRHWIIRRSQNCPCA